MSLDEQCYLSHRRSRSHGLNPAAGQLHCRIGKLDLWSAVHVVHPRAKGRKLPNGRDFDRGLVLVPCLGLRL